MSKRELIKFFSTKAKVELLKRFLCEMSTQAERDDGDFFGLLWEGVVGYKEMTKLEAINALLEFSDSDVDLPFLQSILDGSY